METVDIFLRRDGEQNALRIDVRGQRKLHQNAVDFRPRIQLARSDRQKLVGRDRSGRRDGLAVHAEFGRGLRLAADVNFGRGIVSHQHDGQPGRAPGMRDNALNARPALGFYLVADAITIENHGHQTNVTDGSGLKITRLEQGRALREQWYTHCSRNRPNVV